MDSYMANHKYSFMVCRKLRHAHLQEVGLMQIPKDYVSGMAFGWESKTLVLIWSWPLAYVRSGPKGPWKSSQGCTIGNKNPILQW